VIDISKSTISNKRSVLIIITALIIFISTIVIIIEYTDKMEGGKNKVLTHDEDKRTVTYTGKGYLIKVDYNRMFRISELKLNGENILEPDRGIYTMQDLDSMNSGAFAYSSLTLAQDPTILISEAIDKHSYNAEFNFESTYTTEKVIRITFFGTEDANEICVNEID
jgi:hypothetical protein